MSKIRDLRFKFDEIIREVNTKNVLTSSSEEEPPITVVSEDPYENCDPKFTIASREDLIAEYMGQTAIKTKKVLEKARGGVLFIDEAYSICNMDGGSKDKFGEECLVTINEFMSLHPDEIIIIFAGYKDKLMSSIFKAQPGLYRRCAFFFEIKDYSLRGLTEIFRQQLTKNAWTLDPQIDLEKIFRAHAKLTQGGGGFTEKLAFFSKLMYGRHKFDACISSSETSDFHNSVIDENMLLGALEMFKIGQEVLPEPLDFMYL